MDAVVILYILAILTYIYPIIYYTKYKVNRYMFTVSVAVLVATLFHLISYYGLASGNISMYDTSEFISNIMILLVSITLFKNLHGSVYENKLTTAMTIAPLPIILIAQRGALVLSASPSFIIFGMVLSLNALSLYYSFQLYKARSEGSLYWLILFMFILILTVTTTIYITIEVLEFVGLEEFIETYSTLLNMTKAVLYMIIGLTMSYSAYYHSKKVLPLIRELEVV